MQVFPFKDNGCFAMSALWYVAMRGKLPGTASGIMMEIMKMQLNAVTHNIVPAISADCYVNSYDRVAQWFGIKVYKPARHESSKYICKGNEEEILVYVHNNFTHAVVGNGYGIVTYDPLGYSKTVQFGYLDSKRIISWGN